MDQDEHYINPIERIKSINKTSMAVGDDAVLDELNAERMEQINGLNEHRDDPMYSKLKENRKVLVKQLMMMTGNHVTLSAAYPNLMAEVDKKKNRLLRRANRSGVQKLTHDLLGIKKLVAKKKLNSIQARRDRFAEMSTKTDEYIEQRYKFNRSKKIKLGKAESGFGPLQRFFAYSFHLSKSERRNIQPHQDYAKASKEYFITKVSIDGPNNSKLRGSKFGPEKGRVNGKTVILFSGSGNAGCVQSASGKTISEYCKAGFQVYLIDYRGYGESGKYNTKKLAYKDTSLTEKRLYEDGEYILKGVLKHARVDKCDIILHGYSLGGAVASRLAANEAKKQLKAEGEGKANPRDQLGGLVMDSPMPSMKFAVAQDYGKTIGNFVSGVMGKYSTEENLEKLQQLRPDIPIMFTGGNNTDYLGPQVTGIHNKFNFTNSTNSFNGDSGHLDCHIDAESVGNKFAPGFNEENENSVSMNGSFNSSAFV